MPPSPHDQRAFACRCAWGAVGLSELGRADVIVVVDVLSFTTCVDVAASRGATIVPWAQEGIEAAGPRGKARFSLSPASFLDAPVGLRCVLLSPNGGALAMRARETQSLVLAGCLRNASAVASAARSRGGTLNVCPAGERWPDGSLRPAIEDWLGAGAILAGLPGDKSPDAEAAIAAFERARGALAGAIAGSSSGRELIERGYARDVDLASALDVSTCVPYLSASGFAALESP